MIVCVCNRISEKAAKEVACSGECRSVGELFRCLGCRVRCGKCVPEMRRLYGDAQAHAPGSQAHAPSPPAEQPDGAPTGQEPTARAKAA